MSRTTSQTSLSDVQGEIWEISELTKSKGQFTKKR